MALFYPRIGKHGIVKTPSNGVNNPPAIIGLPPANRIYVRLSGCLFKRPKLQPLRLQGIDPVDPTGLQLDGSHQDSSCASVPPMDGWDGWDE